MLGRLANLLKDLPPADSDVNLLLLGGIGVGKSTSINSISNYLKYPDFKAAENGAINVLVPLRLNIANSEVACGEPDENESHERSKSATQHVKVYLFPLKVDGRAFNLRLVDSPGVGDPRGVEQDNVHIDNILAYLATLKRLHGICFVLKSNETRFTSFIEYCLKQILSRLDKSASDNIIFLTTYSKTAQYTAGETRIHCLEPLVKNIESKPPHVRIPLKDDNVFSLDNEAFRALLEMQQGKSFHKQEMKGFAESWRVSSKECRRLLTYLIGDARTSPLPPHQVESTVSINKVRFLIEQLATPIAEVSEVIQDNLRVLERHKKNLNREDQTVAQLKQQLFIPCVDLKVMELTQPVTVCTDTKCAEVVKVKDTTKWHYKQRCHNPCYLVGVPRQMVGDPGLVHCAAMNDTQTCTECKCDWRVHMHIYTVSEKIQTQKEDTNVRDAIRTKDDARVKIEALMKDLNQRKVELESEAQTISESIATFSFFLQDHALTPFNDAYSDYIKQLIKNEKSLGKFKDPMVIKKLETLLTKHEHLQRALQQNAQKFSALGGNPNLTPQAIKRSIINLYKLKHMGPKIEELIRKSTACRHKETQENFTCVVSPQVDLDEFEDVDSVYGGSTSENCRSEYSYWSSRSRHGRMSPRSEYYSEGARGAYRGVYQSRRSPSASDNSGSDDTISYRSAMSEYYSSKSTKQYDSDNDGTVTYASSKSSRSQTNASSGYGSVKNAPSRSQAIRSSKSRHHDSDDDVSVKYHTNSKSVRSRNRVFDDDVAVQREASSRSSRTRARASDDDFSRSIRSRHQRGSDDEKTSKSTRRDSDDAKPERSSRHKSHGNGPKSVRSSRSKYGHGSDDDKSVSSFSEYSLRSSRPQLYLSLL